MNTALPLLLGQQGPEFQQTLPHLRLESKPCGYQDYTSPGELTLLLPILTHCHDMGNARGREALGEWFKDLLFPACGVLPKGGLCLWQVHLEHLCETTFHKLQYVVPNLK